MTDITTPTALALQLADAYADACFEQGLNQRTEDPAPEAAREKLAANLARIDDYVTEINRLRNVIQAACLGGTDLMIERWKQLFPDAPVPSVKSQTKAASDVLAERRRQINSEGWTPSHDDAHGDGSLAKAAACYAFGQPWVSGRQEAVTIWPWAPGWWKPKDQRRNLVKAGALILAEIERLDRAEARRQAMHICSSCEHPDRCRNDGCYDK